VQETAERLGVSVKIVRRLIESGEVPALQLGGKGHPVRVDVVELEAWLYGYARTDLSSPSPGGRGARDELAVTTMAADSSAHEGESP
jgi:excisionase family DNA binding protein